MRKAAHLEFGHDHHSKGSFTADVAAAGWWQGCPTALNLIRTLALIAGIAENAAAKCEREGQFWLASQNLTGNMVDRSRRTKIGFEDRSSPQHGNNSPLSGNG